MEEFIIFLLVQLCCQEEVLQEVAAEMLGLSGAWCLHMEMSHRSKVYDAIIKEADLRELMNIPDNYKVLFLQGASQQFAMIPMNLMKNKES